MPQSATAVVEHGSLAKGWLGRYRWMGVAAAIIAVVIAIAGIYAARYWPFTEGKVKQSLEEQFAGTATFTGFRKTFFPHPGCILQGLTITPDEKPRNGTPPDRAPLVKTDKLIVMAHYWDVILRPGVVAHVRAVGLQVHIPANGHILRKDNTQSHTLGEAITNDALLEIAKEKGEPLRFAIHRIAMESVGLKERMGYDVAFRNPVPEGEIESRGYFGPWNSDNPGATPVSGTYQYKDADLGKFGGLSGILTSHDAFQGTLEKITTHGTVEVPEFKLRRAGRSVSLSSRFDADVDALNGDVHLNHVENRIEKTNVLAHGDVAGNTGQKGKTTSLELNVSQGRIQDILRIFIKERVSPISGVTSFRAHVVVPPEGKPFEQEVMLTGDFGIEEQRFTKPNTRKEIENLSERARGQKPNEEDDDDPTGVVTNLKGHVDLRKGVATLTSITFSFPGGTAQGHGTFNLLTEKIDFHGTLKTDAEFSKMSSGIKSIFLKPFDAIFKKNPKGSEIPVKLTGTYEHPEPGLEITGGKKKQ